ncbi:hypothetical protein GQ600_21860 [Phytophthora cactorum]|nr:hypothetical protein GQ600_21860 [Phytophthora cactorum]
MLTPIGSTMDQEERRKRHGELSSHVPHRRFSSADVYLYASRVQELSYGVYNFRDVKQHFSRLGWTFRPGPPLSYDHYYIMPGKNPRNKEHKQGVDYFLGEAELVAYARKKKISERRRCRCLLPTDWGVTSDERAAAAVPEPARDSTSESTSDTDGGRTSTRLATRRRIPSRCFDSSDDEYSGAAMDTASSVEEEKEEWTEGGVDVEDDQESEEEAVSSPSEEDTNDESDDGDLEIAASSQISRKLSNSKS